MDIQPGLGMQWLRLFKALVYGCRHHGSAMQSWHGVVLYGKFGIVGAGAGHWRAIEKYQFALITASISKSVGVLCLVVRTHLLSFLRLLFLP